MADVSDAQNTRDLVNLLYAVALGRDAEPGALKDRTAALANGASFAEMFAEVSSSEEAKARLRSLEQPMNSIVEAPVAVDEQQMDLVQRTVLVKLLYAIVLGRDVEPSALEDRIAALNAGASFAEMFAEVSASEEAKLRLRSLEQDRDRQTTGRRSEDPVAAPTLGEQQVKMPFDEQRIDLVHRAIRVAYEHFLRRVPSVDEIAIWFDAISGGMTVERFLATIAESEEGQAKAKQPGLCAELSDGEFLAAASDALFGRGLLPVEVVAWQRRLESEPMTRADLVSAIIGDRIRRQRLPIEKTDVHNPDLCSIMGTARTLSRSEWDKRGSELRSSLVESATERVMPRLEERRFRHSGVHSVSMIASLYKGRGFIEKFLENIVAQSMFDRSELIIVDANSPEREWEVIEKYQKVYDNIVYSRINYRLGIYDAWNVGVETARGKYLTNTNLDDLRHETSLEIQERTLNENSDVDVVYQDFYYSFDPSLSFEQVARFGFKSELPILTPNNLLLFNSPHNAPMWRKSLHDDVGLFDVRYKSAGDYEFWARCLAAGKTFRKTNFPHVVYYQNPNGISTRPDTRGVEEAHDILSRYSSRLISGTLLQSRRDLYRGLGLNAPESAGAQDALSYFDVIHNAMIELGGSTRPPSEEPTLDGEDGGDVIHGEEVRT